MMDSSVIFLILGAVIVPLNLGGVVMAFYLKDDLKEVIQEVKTNDINNTLLDIMSTIKKPMIFPISLGCYIIYKRLKNIELTVIICGIFGVSGIMAGISAMIFGAYNKAPSFQEVAFYVSAITYMLYLICFLVLILNYFTVQKIGFHKQYLNSLASSKQISLF
jgi:hypothetical protein